MASKQDLDSQNNIQRSSSATLVTGNAQEGSEGSSRLRYSRTAKKEASSVEKAVEDKKDTKKVTKGEQQSFRAS